MNHSYGIRVLMSSGREFFIESLSYNKSYNFVTNYINIIIKNSIPIKVSIQSLNEEEQIQKVEYIFNITMKNYGKIIIPESGRWFMKAFSPTVFWREFRKFESTVFDVKIPLFIFNGTNMYMDTAVGIIGDNYETVFNIIEPESNRALNVHTGAVSLKISRGNDNYSIPDSAFNNQGVLEEYIYYNNYSMTKQQPWILTLRDYADKQKKIYHILDKSILNSLYPIWCTWADWHSNDICDEMILENVKLGVDCGIQNFIIDDGWFGPGLDNDYSVKLNIGDWTPDSKKIKNMEELVNSIKKLGGRPIIWCAPHCVAKDALCYESRKKYLIGDGKGKPIICEPQFYSLCFMCKESREIMADICVNLIKKWDFDGAKYDLFNWVPNMKCNNPNHNHDVNSMIEGLKLTMELIHKKTQAIKKDYIVELKQNYGTALLTKWGTMMRAGDAPYDPETNYLRTLHVNSYTPFSLNDYQVISNNQTDIDVAVAIIKMLAAGIPAYSMNIVKLRESIRKILRYYNNWYNENINEFYNYRIPCDAENNVMMLETPKKDIIYLVNNGNLINIKKDTTIFNGTYEKNIFLHLPEDSLYYYKSVNLYGKTYKEGEILLKEGWNHIELPLGERFDIIKDK